MLQERLNNIGPEEFVQTFVKEVKETEPLFRDMKKTRNLEAYVEWFNRLSYLVSTEICVVLILCFIYDIILFIIDNKETRSCSNVRFLSSDCPPLL